MLKKLTLIVMIILSLLSPIVSANDTVSQDISSETQPQHWLDQSHLFIKSKLNKYAQNIDNYLVDSLFADSDTEYPKKKFANANIKLYFDNSWNEYDGFDSDIKVRGKIKLPSTEGRLKLVFGDDEDEKELAELNAKQQTDISQKQRDNLTTSENNNQNRIEKLKNESSLAVRVSRDINNKVDMDLDLGLRSGAKDIYVRGRLDFDHQLIKNYYLDTRQTIRYGTDSKLYMNSSNEIIHRTDNHTYTGWLHSFTYEEHQKHRGIQWFEKLARYHHLDKHKVFSYGVLATGQFGRDNPSVHTYGMTASYQQPIIREWIIIESNINYLKDLQNQRDWHTSAFVRLGLHY